MEGEGVKSFGLFVIGKFPVGGGLVGAEGCVMTWNESFSTFHFP